MFIHVKIDLVFSSIQKDVQERVLLKVLSLLHGDFAQPYSRRVPQKALNVILSHK